MKGEGVREWVGEGEREGEREAEWEWKNDVRGWVHEGGRREGGRDGTSGRERGKLSESGRMMFERRIGQEDSVSWIFFSTAIARKEKEKKRNKKTLDEVCSRKKQRWNARWKKLEARKLLSINKSFKTILNRWRFVLQTLTLKCNLLHSYFVLDSNAK